MMSRFHSYYFGSMGCEPMYKPFTLNVGTEMTPDVLLGLISRFAAEKVPRYDVLASPWERDFEIFSRPKKEPWKPDNRLAANFARNITKTFEGYYIGVPAVVSHDEPIRNQWLSDYFSRVNQADIDADLSEGCSKYGNAFELLYSDEDGDPCSTYVDARSAFVVYDNTVKHMPMFGVTVSVDDDGVVNGEWFDHDSVTSYRYGSDGVSFGPTVPHNFGGIPLIEYVQDSSREGLYESAMSLIDAFNRCISEKSNDVEYFADAYMLVTGAKLPDDFKEDLRKLKIINMWGDGPNLSVSFLQKPDADSTQENLLNRLETLLYKTSMVPDITDSSFYTASGEALEKRLMPMDNMAKTKDRKFVASIRHRLKLLASYPTSALDDDDWIQARVVMRRNEPKNIDAEASTASRLSGIVSQRTQLGLLSFVDDPASEIDRINAEKASKAAISADGYETARAPRREATMYEITSILGKRKRGDITYNNAVRMLERIGVDEDEAVRLLEDKDPE